MAKNQTNEVIEYLRKHKSLTQRVAFKKFGIQRLGSIIFVLRKRGYEIETEMVYGKTRYGTMSPYAIYHFIKDIEEVKNDNNN